MRTLSVMCLCLACGCVGTRTGNPSNADVPVGATLAKSDKPRDAQPSLSFDDAATFGRDNQAFALDLYAELDKQQPGNLFFSPYSISTALAMAYAGAEGDTATEMASALHFTLSPPTLHIAFNATGSALEQRPHQLVHTDPATPPTGDGFQLHLENQAWARQGLGFADRYLDILATNYGAGVFTLDFSDPEAARTIINGWVSDRTEQRIPHLLPPDALGTNTQLVLTNAVYFKASWLDDFDPQLTASASFHGEQGDSDVSMMHYSGQAQYAMVGGYQAVARRFLSPSVQMLLILPPAGESTGTFNVARLTEIRAALMPYQVDLSLPKWEFESANTLKQPLRNLGMNAPFDEGADFSGITGMRGLSINQIYHNAFVTVDEHGAEAAAATAVVFADASGGLDQATITFDRPFIFLIYDEPTAQILFLGRVTDI